MVIDGDIGLMNTSEILVQNALKKTVGFVKKSSNRLQFQLTPSAPVLLKDSDDGNIVLTINNQSQLAINATHPSADAAVFVNGDTVFNGPVFYEDMGKALIQSFLLKTTSTDANSQTEVRSVRSLIIDEFSGLSYSVSKENQSIELYAPNYYVKLYESPRYDGVLSSGQRGFVEPNGKDIIAFKEVYPNGGVSINVVDTDSDTQPDSIELYNPLIDGGIIEGTITLNGQLYVNGTDADGTEVTSIPFRWQQQLTHLTYASGNVGIDTRFPQTDLDVASTMGAKELNVSHTAYVDSIHIQNESMTTVNQMILFGLDADNTNDYDTMLIANGGDPLFSLKPRVDDGDVRVGFLRTTLRQRFI